ncbi:2-oxo acid dehydrogenase subunit E2 [Buchnera aphidicola]|uniref:Dihydrolipoamide acetyltransferase component of pyruvate dehydrogenase complex n=1 Tax=Buchnera aphidicola subsp. Tuberolachnus salignus TaxID=98804 RepID=A0A160SWG2_BUCTT|nr:2-oxo acid dehydrogenase subunit E2 [Buchnera aphidicola]CUR53122.1 Dihydrolipoyllysine-residue acetyltransferase component of pyruvate dehydrogenase complex [Buchnera aphidicola (Tuberolachnus salignus)]
MDINIYIPDIGIENAEVIEILVKEGEEIKKEKSLIILEGQKSSLEIPSPVSGKIKKIFIKIGDILKKGSMIMSLDKCEPLIIKKNILEENCKKQKIKNSVSLSSNTSKNLLNNHLNKNKNFSNYFVYASPFIRRLAFLKNIDLTNIIGSGRKGRILKIDLLNFNQNNTKKTLDSSILKLKENKINDDIDKKNVHYLTSIQKIVGQNLLKNWKNIPHVTQFDEVDITKLEKFRLSDSLKELKNSKEDKITILSFIIKTISFILKKFPLFNSTLHFDQSKVILHPKINIGVAMDTPEGLLVPVIKDVEKINIFEIALILKKFSLKIKEKKLNVLDMKEGTFTVSSLGGLGGVGFTPIINAPEVCILGISKSQIKPIWNGKEFVPRLILPFSISYDHRVINGADAVRFTTFFKKCLNDIRILLL